MSGPFPEDSAARKTYPLYSGVLQYFPAALAALAHHSYLGNEKHNPGQPLHWSRGKSDDHLDAAARHLAEGDLVGLAWRALAALQIKCEADGSPIAPGADVATPVEGPAGWVSWNPLGNEWRPSNRPLVDVMWTGGAMTTGYAGEFIWHQRGGLASNIAAYRVVKEGE